MSRARPTFVEEQLLIKSQRTMIKNLRAAIKQLVSENQLLLKGEKIETTYEWRPKVDQESIERAVLMLQEAVREHMAGKKFTLTKHEARAVRVILAAMKRDVT